jgi:hypothetical protein
MSLDGGIDGVKSSLPQREPIPLVIVEGFLGGAGPLLWGNFERHWGFDQVVDDERPGRRVIFAR